MANSALPPLNPPPQYVYVASLGGKSFRVMEDLGDENLRICVKHTRDGLQTRVVNITEDGVTTGHPFVNSTVVGFNNGFKPRRLRTR